jgi:hypothetical protein
MFIYITRQEPLLVVFIASARSVEGLLWGAEPRFELGPALQQANALLIAPRQILIP